MMVDKTAIGTLVVKIVNAAIASGLSWDEAVAGCGIAANVLAEGASRAGDGTLEDCQAHARKRFEQGFAQSVALERVIASVDPVGSKNASPEMAESVHENSNLHILLKTQH